MAVRSSGPDRDPGRLLRQFGPRRPGRAGPTNVADIARAFGLRGIRVEQPGAIGAALREALATDETGVVDVATDIESRAPEPWLPEGGT